MNTPDKNAATVDVGKQLKELRQEKRMSIRDVGRKSGISANALSMIERGLTSPSVSTLYRLVDALGVPITAIFRAKLLREDIVFRKVSERTQVPFPLGVWEGLGGEVFAGRLQPFVLTLKSGADSGAQMIVHTGHEFVMCLQGNLDYTVEGEKFELEPGDSLLFAARLQHCWNNSSDTDTIAMIILSGFEEFENPAGYHISS